MITFKVAKLAFEMPLHLSKGKGGNESSADILHSDTIKSAIYAIGKQYLQEAFPENFLDRFFISSAFPYYREEYFSQADGAIAF